MTDQATQVAGNDISVPETFDSPSSAADFLAGVWEKQKKSADGADAATADEELPVEGNTDPQDAAPGEDEDADPADKEPPIERPKSWSETEEAEWQATPRALQQKIAARELERDTALRRAQNDAAEKLKGLTAKEQQADEARQKYEAKLPQVMQGLIEVNNRDYADIKSQADIDTLVRAMNQFATTDPVQAQQINAYLTGWQMHQQKMAAIRAEVDQAEQGKMTKERTDWADFMGQENAKARELIPELADPVKGPALEKRAAEHLTKIGFKDDELNALAAGKQKLGVYDHRLQLLINDSLKLAELQQAKATIPAKAAPKGLPPVQRPGVSRPAGAGNSERIQALEAKLNNSGSEADAFALLMARRAAASRAS